MKKTLLVIAFFSGTYSLLPAQTYLGISAGPTFGSMKTKIENESVSSQYLTGFMAGLNASVSLTKNISVRPEINFVQKGASAEIENENGKETTKFNCLEFPLNLVFNNQSKMGKFFVGGGPSITYSIMGKYKYDGELPERADLSFGKANYDDFKSFEFGINALIGYQLTNGLYLAANYNQGLTNLINIPLAEVHSNYFGIRLGMMLKGQ
ncbi:MAG: porin family protein [Bacteroidota bacterium]